MLLPEPATNEPVPEVESNELVGWTHP